MFVVGRANDCAVLWLYMLICVIYVLWTNVRAELEKKKKEREYTIEKLMWPIVL